jgi:hypothetical protein
MAHARRAFVLRFEVVPEFLVCLSNHDNCLYYFSCSCFATCSDRLVIIVLIDIPEHLLPRRESLRKVERISYAEERDDDDDYGTTTTKRTTKKQVQAVVEVIEGREPHNNNNNNNTLRLFPCVSV